MRQLGAVSRIEMDAEAKEKGAAVYEGIVFHHPDGRMAKIKRRDFGLKWPLPAASEEPKPCS